MTHAASRGVQDAGQIKPLPAALAAIASAAFTSNDADEAVSTNSPITVKPSSASAGMA